MAPTPNVDPILSHALLIQAGAGTPVGAISTWSPSQSQDVAELWAFGGMDGTGVASRGAPSALAPGNVREQSLDIQRYDVWASQFEDVFAVPPLDHLDMLGDNNDPLTFKEIWTAPSARTGSFRRIYRGSWLTRVGRTISATSERVVNVNAQARYLGKTMQRL